MSLTSNNGVKCDFCGKISRNEVGEYIKNKMCMYIRAIGNTDKDICDECVVDYNVDELVEIVEKCGIKEIKKLHKKTNSIG